MECLEFGGIVVEVWVRGHREQLRQLPLPRRQSLSKNRETWSVTCIGLKEGFESTLGFITYSAWDLFHCSCWEGCIASNGHVWERSINQNTRTGASRQGEMKQSIRMIYLSVVWWIGALQRTGVVLMPDVAEERCTSCGSGQAQA